MGAICDPCQRRGPRLALPPDFFDAPPLKTALAGYDFGTVFLAIRDDQRWTQETLGDYLGVEQSRISEIERGVRQLRDVRLVSHVARKFTIPGVKLGFPDGTTVGGGALSRRKGGSWVERRDFVQHVAGLTLGLGAAGIDIDRLGALLPHTEPTGTRRVGLADVEVIEEVTAAFVRQDYAHGSGLIRDAAVSQLRTVLPLLNTQLTPEVRPQLMVATARLAMQSGWMSFECKQHDAARRLWLVGLNIARKADHPQADDLTVYLLYDMALQAVHLGRPDEARHLTQIGRAVAGGKHPVSASTTCSLANIQARAHAAEGDAAGCDRALAHAAEHFALIEPVTAPPWTGHVSEAAMSGFQGIAHYTLALASPGSRGANTAVPLLRNAVEHIGPSLARFRGFYLPDLAGVHALAGDTDTAVTVGHQAIDAITSLSSPRAYDRLRTLHTALEPMHTSHGVAELRDRLTATAA